MNLFFEEDEQDDDYISYLCDDELSMTRAPSEHSSSSSLGTLEGIPESPHVHQQPRRSIRKSLVHALSSPVKAARNTVASPVLSPTTRSPSKRKLKLPAGFSSKKLLGKDERKTWQEKFDLPKDITREQAMAVLLCRELEMMDI